LPASIPVPEANVAAAATEPEPPRTARPNGAADKPVTVVFPVDHPPDDPGPDKPEEPPKRRGFFG
jgi:hypothetical protein